ncbi:MAG: hypothetical protein PHQ58_06370 [Rhodoferax sp.]|uniref:glycine zipper 2TM domain-containing protein n=1 Tax=Rhodoferax sp. TaxID=50421 RepID=UPI002621796D|nr:hypothetical protein [Rhodoferax sp.]MDD2880042.1 hypothetical protein [Rhodoferax sp.]
MKKLILFTSLALAGWAGFAQELGRVLSSTPITQQVGVPRQVCTTQQVQVAQPKSGAGAVLGAIAGGALANAAAHGPGQTAATMIGIIGGAVIGDRIEVPAAAQVQNVQRCATQTFYENRTVAYDVVYDYAGKQYAVQMPNDPGPTLQLQVTPVGSFAAAVPGNHPEQGQVTYAQPGQVIVAQPTDVPVYLDLGWGYWGGHRGHGYWR